MEEQQPNSTPAWEAMEVEEVGHVGEILQVTKVISPPIDQDGRTEVF
jgi:hypothetical protein